MAGLSDVNIIAEISDQALEDEFRGREMSVRMRVMSVLALAGGVAFSLVTFVNISSSIEFNNIWVDVIGRLAVLLLAVILYICVRFNLSYPLTALVLTFTELLVAYNALIIIYQVRGFDFLSLSLCAVACISVIFAAPGRWIYSFLLSVALGAGIVVISAQNTLGESDGDLLVCSAALAVILLSSGCLSFMNSRSRRRHFIWEHDQLRRSLTDGLTEIGNRKRFELDMNEALLLAQRNVPFCVVMLDIDNFPQFAEKYGASVGDSALVAFSKLILQNIRGYECFSRYDTSTFCLLTPHTAMDDAAGLAQRLCRVTTMREMDLPERLSCGVGVAANRPGDTRESIMERVARCTAHAQLLGKNMVITEMELDEGGEETDAHGGETEHLT